MRYPRVQVWGLGDEWPGWTDTLPAGGTVHFDPSLRTAGELVAAGSTRPLDELNGHHSPSRPGSPESAESALAAVIEPAA